MRKGKERKGKEGKDVMVGYEGREEGRKEGRKE